MTLRVASGRALYVLRSGSLVRVDGGAGTTPPANVAPVASFTNTPTGLSVAVTSTATDSDGTIANYAWNWGDSATTTGSTSSHTYASSGTYTITHTVTDDDGATHSATASVTVAPVNVAPVAGFNVSTNNLTASVTSTATDSDGTIASTSWNWGDGSGNSTGTTASHTYTAGTYTITQTVTDNSGGTNSTTKSVTVPAVLPTDTFTGTGNLAGAVTTTGNRTWQQRLASSGSVSTTSNNVTKLNGTVGTRVSSGPGSSIWLSHETGSSDGTWEITLAATGTTAATQGGGFGVRIGANASGVYLSLRNSSTVQGYSLGRINNGGGATTIQNTTQVPVAGDRIKIVASGSTVTAFVNNVQIAQSTNETVNQTSTEVGIWFTATTSTFEQRWDDYARTA